LVGLNGKKIQLKYWPSARFGPSERFALSSIPELLRYLPKRSVPGRADAVRGLPFVSIEFISVDCAVPSRADPIQYVPSLNEMLTYYLVNNGHSLLRNLKLQNVFP
jgi:hypothetical protein